MRVMGWDWWTFHRQPDNFIYAIKKFLDAEYRADVNISKRTRN